MKIYKHQTVLELEEFYGALLFDIQRFNTIEAHLAALALRMLEGIKSREACVFKQINNYHKDFLSASVDRIVQANFDLDNCKTAIAHEHGFNNWKAVAALDNVEYNLPFEQAVNYLLMGNYEALEAMLSAAPQLIHEVSQYGHKATLLHYVASNGVEMWRQKVPSNLPALCELLLSKGADASAKMSVYGGYFDSLSLLMTSAHPKKAGLVEEVAKLLNEAL